jgi:hypothetical protein
MGQRGWLAPLTRLALVIGLIPAFLVVDAGVAEAVMIPRTMSDHRPVGVGVVAVDFPFDFLAVSWHAPDAKIDAHSLQGHDIESHGAVRFRHDGTWGPWQPFFEDGVQARQQWSSSLVEAGDAEAYQIRGIPQWAESPTVIAINTTDGELVNIGEQRRGAADAVANCVSRAEWGADESKRFVDSVESWPTTFFPAQGLVVHHTVTPNNDPFSGAARVRAIYQQHAVGNGWGDIGYQYLIDEAGFVYEGRWSGTESVPCAGGGLGDDFAHDDTGKVVTAGHTAYHNQGNIGIALLGNFASHDEYDDVDPGWVQVDPKEAAVAALRQLLTILATRHDIDPLGTFTYANPMCDLPSDQWTWECDDLTLPYFPGVERNRISGHRDWKATACPGAALYAMLDSIRSTVSSAVGKPPVVTVSQDPLLLEGNTLGGYEGSLSGVSAVDPDGGDVTLTHNAPAELPMGDTAVLWRATEPDGLSATASQTVTVSDTVPPDATAPEAIVVGAATDLGTNVEFTVSVSDVVDPEPSVVCAPASGSLFPVGVTSVSCVAEDASGNQADVAFDVTVVPIGHTIGLVDVAAGRWHLYDNTGVETTSFYFGNPGDYPIMGDWDGDGVETPGLYRQSDGYVYLRNSNTQGIADLRFFFGNPGDVPIAGDFNGDGFDTVSIYRPSQARFYIINRLGSDNGGLGASDFDYLFGNPGDKPFVGDFDGDGIETVGLHRESSGLVYFRNSHTQGIADSSFLFGNPGDRLIAGDWNGDDTFTPAVFRPPNSTAYFRYTNSQGAADYYFTAGQSEWVPVSGETRPPD